MNAEESLNLLVQDLRRRIAALEAAVFKRHAVSLAVQSIIEDWPGLFTAQQIEAALKEKHPDLGAGLKVHAVPSLIARWEKRGIISRETTGRGCVASIYLFVKPFRQRVGQGVSFGRTAKYESGFRSIVRGALADPDFPEPFILDDLRAWMGKHLPNVQVPYGSWSSTLYKLQTQNELRVIEARGKTSSVNRKVYGRGPIRVAPSGEEIQQMEESWQKFRESMNVQPIPEFNEHTLKAGEAYE